MSEERMNQQWRQAQIFAKDIKPGDQVYVLHRGWQPWDAVSLKPKDVVLVRWLMPATTSEMAKDLRR